MYAAMFLVFDSHFLVIFRYFHYFREIKSNFAPFVTSSTHLLLYNMFLLLSHAMDGVN